MGTMHGDYQLHSLLPHLDSGVSNTFLIKQWLPLQGMVNCKLNYQTWSYQIVTCLLHLASQFTRVIPGQNIIPGNEGSRISLKFPISINIFLHPRFFCFNCSHARSLAISCAISFIQLILIIHFVIYFFFNVLRFMKPEDLQF